jgi:hypothetical protein
LTGAVASAEGRALALFLHKPLCQHRLDEADLNYWSVLQPARDALLGAFGSTAPRFVASGHIHQWRDHAPSGLRQIWAPAISFIVGEEQQPSLGSKLLGAASERLPPALLSRSEGGGPGACARPAASSARRVGLRAQPHRGAGARHGQLVETQANS